MTYSYDASGSPSLTQSLDYYLFGLAFHDQCISLSENKYLYNGKELQEELGWETYNYRARFYDQQIDDGIETIGYNYVREPKGCMKLSKNDLQWHMIEHLQKK